MNPGITAKLFVAFLLTSTITAVAVGFGVRTAIDQGFEKYVEEREDARRERLANELASAYKEHGSWDFMRGDERQWAQINSMVRPQRGDFPGGPRGRARDFGGGFRAPALRPDHAAAAAGPRPPEDPLHDGPPRFMRTPPGVVLDLFGQRVAGDSEVRARPIRKPIVVDGKRVGDVAFARNLPFEPVERRFQEQVWRASLVVALAVMALSGIVAWFLSRGLLAPVKRIAEATRRLADGQYATRVASASRDELGQLADDFNRLGNALEKNEASRRQFMADVSHELRTPLAVLKGELEAIDDGVRAPDKDAIASLQGEVARLSKLVDDIHDLSLADVGGIAYRFETLDLRALVQEALERAGGRIAAAHLALRFDAPSSPLFVRADAQRLGQLVMNLLENSLRYTDPGGTLQVRLARQDNRALLDWQDSKPGVPPEALPRLFDRLYRVEHSRARASGGSGLGLAIARSIAEAHGGHIDASASALGGVRILVQLPLSESR